MKVILGILTRIFSSLLRLYPVSFREKFEDEMLSDFADTQEEAVKKGVFSLLLVCLRELRDFPVGLLSAHLWEGRMNTHLRSELTRSVFRSAFALGLAYAAAMAVFWTVASVMAGQGWLFLLRIAKSQGWRLNYGAAAETVLYFSGLVSGALLGGVLLAVCFGEIHRIKLYLLACILGWVGPFVLIRSIGVFLSSADSVLIKTIFSQVSIILIGLGFGVLFSLVAQDRKTRPWLLLVSVLGYYLARSLGILLLPLVPDNYEGLFNWNVIAFVAVLYGVEGVIVGALLGAVSGWSKSGVVSVSTT